MRRLLGLSFIRVSATTFLKAYVVTGVVVLLAGFILYSQWILSRLEERGRALVQPLAQLYSYVPALEDRKTSLLVRDAISGISARKQIRFVIVDGNGTPLLARGFDDEIERKLDDGEPLTPSEEARFMRAFERMSRHDRNRIPIEYPPTEQGRRIIGYMYFGDVDAEFLADIPLVLADVDGNPIAWRIYAGWETNATHPDNRRRAEALKRDATRFNRVEDIQINPMMTSGVFYYELPPLRPLQWMPYVQAALVIGFVAGGVGLYQRIRSQEHAAIWAGLAKESAHQLGTPITSLMGWVDLARESNAKRVEADSPSVYEEMERDLDRLRRIVARFSQVGQAPTRAPIDVVKVVQEAADYFRGRLPQRSTRMEIVETYAETPLVEAHEELMQWVIENLIRNAMDAIEAAHAPLGQVELTTAYEPERRCVTITVIDNGTGVPRANRRRVFDPGFTTKTHGWGVGLALAKRIVESYHGGRIRLRDTGEDGSVFTVELPAVN